MQGTKWLMCAVLAGGLMLACNRAEAGKVIVAGYAASPIVSGPVYASYAPVAYGVAYAPPVYMFNVPAVVATPVYVAPVYAAPAYPVYVRHRHHGRVIIRY